jgi:hypothetical protein
LAPSRPFQSKGGMKSTLNRLKKKSVGWWASAATIIALFVALGAWLFPKTSLFSMPQPTPTNASPSQSISVGGSVNGPIVQGSGNTVIINPTSEIPTLSATPTATPMPISLPMVFEKMKVVDTGLTGQICGYSKVHSIVRDLNGNLHVFYDTASDPTTVFESTSNDNGATWSSGNSVAGFVVNGKIVGFSCAAALDSLGNISLFFDLSASDIGYTVWSPVSGWKESVIRGQGLPDVGNFAVNIATGPGSQVHAVWSSKKLWYTFFDGKGWSPELEVAPGGWHPDIFVDNNDVRHVVYNGANFIPDKSGNGSSPVTVYYTYSADGIHWSDEKTVPPDDGIWKGDSTIKVDSTGRRHITYIEWAPLEGDLYYTYSDDGQAWSQPFKLNVDPGVITGTVGSESAAMLLDPNDNLYVVWQAVVPGDPHANRLILRWLNKSTQKWSDPTEIAKVYSGIGDQPSMPYQVYGWKDRNSFILDIAWTSAGKIYYGQVSFHAAQ